MKQVNRYELKFPSRKGEGSCTVAIYAADDVARDDANAYKDRRPLLVLVTQRQVQHQTHDSIPQIATLIYEREGFKTPEDIRWCEDCAIREDIPSLWEMLLEYVTKGILWRKRGHFEEHGGHTPLRNRAGFFQSIGTDDPKADFAAYANLEAEWKEDLESILHETGNGRAWFGVESKPEEMRAKLLRERGKINDAAAAELLGNELFFAVKRQSAECANPVSTHYRASTLQVACEKMLAVCEEAMQRPGETLSFEIILPESAVEPVENLG